MDLAVMPPVAPMLAKPVAELPEGPYSFDLARLVGGRPSRPGRHPCRRPMRVSDRTNRARRGLSEAGSGVREERAVILPAPRGWRSSCYPIVNSCVFGFRCPSRWHQRSVDR